MALIKTIIGNLSVIALCAAGLAACSSEEGEPSGSNGGNVCGTCTEPDSSVDLMAPAVSFQADLFGPILQQKCNSYTCHGAPPGLDEDGDYPAAELYLGATLDNMFDVAIDAALMTTIVTNLKADSKTAPAAKIVVPGDPGASFVVAKIYACQNERQLACMEHSLGLATHCTTSACGDPMPPQNKEGNIAQLDDAQRNTIRRWIAQGALDN